MRRIVIAAVAAAVGCGGAEVARERQRAGSEAHAEPVVETPVDGGPRRAAAEGDEAAARAVQRALVLVSMLRGLEARGPVRHRVVDRAFMVDHVAKKVATDVPADVLEAHREMLVLLGVVPVDFDYVQSVLELLGAQLAGFYEPDDRTMYLAADLPEAERRATLAHELVHALQDQHYDLGSRLEYAPDRSDERSALHALAEGDAMSAMLDDVLATSGRRAIDLPDAMIGAQVRAGIALDPKSARVPQILRASVAAPYVDGTVLVNGLRREGGWARVDALWRDPPTTTEQVLHPEKLVGREPAVPVDVPPAPGAEWTLLYRDVLGEQSVLLTLDEWLPLGPAKLAASGWGGDRVAVYRTGTRYALAWHVKYDDRAAAARGFDGFAVAAGPAGATARPERCVERVERGPLAVVASGVSVVVVAGPISRNGAAAQADGNCTEALRWARAVASR